MTWLLDIIIAAIIGLSIFFGAKNGFVKTAVGAASFIIAIIITATFASPLSDGLKSTGIGEGIESATQEFISDLMLDNSLGIEELINGDNQEFNDFAGVAGAEEEELLEWYSQEGQSENPVVGLSKKLAAPIVNIITTVLAVIILFVGSQILLSVAGWVITKICRLPVLRTCNTLFGVVLGAALALVRISMFCFVVNILIENSDFLGIGWISNLDPESTLLYNIFRHINIFSFFI